MTDKQYRWVPSPIGSDGFTSYDKGERWILQSKCEFTGYWITLGRVVKYRTDERVYSYDYKNWIGNKHNSMREAAMALLASVKE